MSFAVIGHKGKCFEGSDDLGSQLHIDYQNICI